MYLKGIEVQGFKSFPDKTVLNFNKGMTAVVGPNGSGKSNISDAVRWVLGEQSSKTLRGSKMEDVIFSGTQTRRPQGFAEVTLKLDNKDRSLKTDCDEILITRRYFRSGDSEYRLNGDIVRLRDINELFMDTGLGRDGYSMVSQGRIEEIVSSKSGERRDMFEEAAGISHYRYSRSDTIRRLEQSEDNLLRLRDILAELEGRVAPLKVQSENAEKFLRLSEEKKELDIGLWLYNFDRAAQGIREQRNRVTVVEIQSEDCRKALEKIFADTEEATAKGREITFKIEDIQRSLADFEEKAAAHDSLAAVYKKTVELNDESIERIEKDKRVQDEAFGELSEKAEHAQSLIDELNAKIEDKKKGLEDASQELEKVRSTHDKHSKELSGLLEERNSVFSQISEKRILLSSAEASVSQLESRAEAAKHELALKQQELSTIEQKIEELTKQLEDIEENSLSLKNSVSALEIKVRLRAEKEEKEKNSLNTALIASEQIKSQIKLLEEMEKNMEGYTGSVKAVMREVRRGMLRGIHGPLSQLISVESKYACAIETALGSALQHIVTDNENDAKNAMNFLKKNNIGRATFLPLSTIRPNKMDEKGLARQEGFIGEADKLVSADSKYSAIISSFLARTAVVDDIDNAIEIARKFNHRFKIVTLDGQVIHTGGSMTGGSAAQNSGFLSRANEIDLLHEQLIKSEKSAFESEKSYKTLCLELAELQAVLRGTQAELLEVGEKKVKTESAVMLCQGQIAESKKLAVSLSDELKIIDEKKAGFEKSSCEAREELAILSESLEKLDGGINELGEGRESLLKLKDKLNEESSRVNIEIAEILKEIEAAKDALESYNRRSLMQSQRIGELNAEIDEFKAKNMELSIEIEQENAGATEIREQAKEERLKIDELVSKREQYEKQVYDLRAQERNKNDESMRLAQELTRLQERLAILEKEQETIEKQLYDEYELTRREAESLEISIESAQKASKRISELKNAIRSLGSINVAAIEEYKEVSARYEFMSAQLSDTEKSKKELEKMIEELTLKMAQQFSERFKIINERFKECFYHLFSGGDAELVLEDETNVLECGIEIKAQPPGKNVKTLSLLSGGEKGLCAIAILFAMLKVSPSPFCVYDEIEAALDDVNVVRFAQFVRKMTDNTQFILITHRRGTMEEADTMYGVTMQEEGVSKLLELKTAEMAKELGID